MKIFISWSGERSRQVADLLSNWIQCVLQAVDPWLSSKDIDRGSLWFSEITNQLSNTHNGIVCLTKSNLDKPWILFESGALAKGLNSSRVYTFLIDLTSNDVKDPLAQFNHTLPTKDGVYQLVRTINNSLEPNALKENILSNVFETYWPQFEKDFKEIIKNTKDEDVVIERPKEDIMNEILQSVRGLDRRVRSMEEIDYIIRNQISHSDIKLNQNNLRMKNDKNSLFRTPIEEFNLSVRTINSLKKSHIDTLEEYINSDNQRLANLGDEARKEIGILMEKYL
jgi:hypothetical protein